jgi:hypothetical protein
VQENEKEKEQNKERARKNKEGAHVLGLGFLAAVYFKLEIFRNIMQFSR